MLQNPIIKVILRHHSHCIILQILYKHKKFQRSKSHTTIKGHTGIQFINVVV